MSTFGEIVEPTSRATWEDWDEIFTEEISLENLNWHENVDLPTLIDKFFVFEGKYLYECVKTQSHHDLQLVNFIPKVNLYLYKNSSTYVCIVKDYNLLQSSEIIEMLKPYLLISEEVIAIQTKSFPEFFTTGYSTYECIIRAITTTIPPKCFKDEFTKLEQPNIISGISAGIVSLREYLDKTAIAIVCYVEHAEEHQIEDVQKLLKNLNIVQDIKSRQTTILNSNLYI